MEEAKRLAVDNHPAPASTDSVGEEIEEQVSLENCFLDRLPRELFDGILSYLRPVDLISFSATCRDVRKLVMEDADHIWQALVEEQVPGPRIRSSNPCSTFRELYQAHDPRWFLTKSRLWFSDSDMTGKVMLVRYNQRRGSIEGFQLLAVNRNAVIEQWAAHPRVRIHSFEPDVYMHLDQPLLFLPAINREEKSDESKPKANRYQEEKPMYRGTAGTISSSFMFTRLLHSSMEDEIKGVQYPYRGIFPTPMIPATRRTVSLPPATSTEQPTRRREMSQHTFRIRKWLEMRVPRPGVPRPGAAWLTDGGLANSTVARPIGLRVGEEIHTYATIDPAIYTPTPAQPWRGVWVGDYSVHGCEFVLINQRPSSAMQSQDVSEHDLAQKEDEKPEEFERRNRDALVYHGALEAIKLTGDVNVPRGECTFIAEDIGEAGLITTYKNEPFAGVRAFKSKGHIANTGFINDRWVDTQLCLISHDCIAQFWVDFGYVNYYHRVNFDQFYSDY
ncbi:hypothetical protein B0H63DRAFT_522755 [Podospora didyma]|uniref:F-box domain-containing protein n=1 Tax=Podospora didyma TaxID=330526 RepID=A0AAE0NPQ4_9PEZI|nr:hypothetical protein B0H63DRAFT_522755 [Podospora didyma]